MKREITILICFVFLGFAEQNINAQEPVKTLPQTDNAFTSKPTSCEVSLLFLDGAINKTQKKADTNLIVIARLGKEEKSKKVILTRLEFIKNYLGRVRNVKNHVLAEGEKTSGFGVIELYVEGKLERVIYMAKNAKNICPVPIG